MSKEVESLRAADSDRQRVADRLKSALDEGRLSLHEYDERVAAAYAARTHAELRVLVQDLPRPRLRPGERPRLPTALIVLWTVWGAIAAVNVVIYVLVTLSTAQFIHPWPIWLLVPGAALGAVTVGVQKIRGQQREEA